MAKWNIDEIKVDKSKFNQEEFIRVLSEYFESESFQKDKRKLREIEKEPA